MGAPSLETFKHSVIRTGKGRVAQAALWSAPSPAGSFSICSEAAQHHEQSEWLLLCSVELEVCA